MEKKESKQKTNINREDTVYVANESMEEVCKEKNIVLIEEFNKIVEYVNNKIKLFYIALVNKFVKLKNYIFGCAKKFKNE